MPARLEHVRMLGRAVGGVTAANVLLQRALKSRKPMVVRSGASQLTIDPLGSDLFVAAQVFGARDYQMDAERTASLNRIAAELKAAGRTPVIVDAGANVGYSPLFFAATYPDAVVIAVEPDTASFERMKAQCAGEARILPVHAAVWRHNDGVDLGNTDAPSWARTVREGSTTTPSFTLEALMEKVPNAAPLILKLDIEGAERVVVEASKDLVRSFPCLMIEPHDFMLAGAGCLSPLFAALAGKEMDTLIQGENVFFADSSLVKPS